MLLEALRVLLFGNPEISMSLGPLALFAAKALIGAGIGAGVSKLTGGGGSGGAPANPQLTEQSQIETDLLKRQRDIIDMLFEMAQNYDGKPIGRLEGLEDSKFLDEDFLGSLQPRGDIELLQSLLGRGVGSGATQQLSALEQQRAQLDERARESQGESIAGVIDSLLALRRQQQGGAAQNPGQDAVAAFQQQLANQASNAFLSLGGLPG